MSTIENRIAQLKEELADLEGRKLRGFFSVEDTYVRYDLQKHHTCIYDIDENLVAVIVNEDLVRTYLKQKDEQNEN